MLQTNGTLHSGELAKAAGVSPDTIRHYENIGILPTTPRSTGGYRIYPPSAVNRVQVVQRALRIGFTLAELSEIFRTRDGGGVPCQRVFELAGSKLVAIDEDIAALKKTRRYLANVLADWKGRIRKTNRGERAHLLQTLNDEIEHSRRSGFGGRKG
ncbi:MAG: heavy metal-responsive transcriptional regulator [Candidatus Sulfotelmatobacter sp.]